MLEISLDTFFFIYQMDMFDRFDKLASTRQNLKLSGKKLFSFSSSSLFYKKNSIRVQMAFITNNANLTSSNKQGSRICLVSEATVFQPQFVQRSACIILFKFKFKMQYMQYTLDNVSNIYLTKCLYHLIKIQMSNFTEKDTISLLLP